MYVLLDFFERDSTLIGGAVHKWKKYTSTIFPKVEAKDCVHTSEYKSADRKIKDTLLSQSRNILCVNSNAIRPMHAQITKISNAIPPIYAQITKKDMD